MNKIELKELIKEVIRGVLNEGKGSEYIVKWSDRDYKSFEKVFYDKPSGPPENGLIQAKKFMKSLVNKDEKNSYGLYRDITIEIK